MQPPLTLLTLGDGDWSASLAILRAYNNKPINGGDNGDGDDICVIRHLVATTLMPSRESLVETYPLSAPAILQELESDARVTILYGVDATQLHTNTELLKQTHKFDIILFHHPHLGYCDPSEIIKSSSDDHAKRHAALLAHYFDSASKLLSLSAVDDSPSTQEQDSCIHVCLCSGAVKTWELDTTIQHLNMEYVHDSPIAASRPLLETILVNSDESAGDGADKTATTPASKRQKTKKTKGGGSGGSRKGHWLGKYGYRHKPTFPHVTEFQTNVSSSYHYFVRSKQRYGDDNSNGSVELVDDIAKDNLLPAKSQHQYSCSICRQVFPNVAALQAHLIAPALPVSAT